MATKLIVTVDTEEEGLWSGSFRSFNNTVANIKGIPAFQAICDNHNLAPVYLVDSPVVESDVACKLLDTINLRGGCEIGSHLHPWNTLPTTKPVDSYHSYMSNLDSDTQLRKLENLTDAIQRRLGVRPTSFRAGRYGMNIAGIKNLVELGYTVDSSVCPFMDYSADGGPNYFNFPFRPYYVGETFDSPMKDKTGLLEIPVSFGFNWQNFSVAFALHEALAHRFLKPARLRGIAERLGMLKKIKFSPEKHQAADLKALARIYSEQNLPSLVMMFHSSSLVPGLSPYVQNEEELKTFLNTIDAILDYCLTELSMSPATLNSFAKEARNLSLN